MKIKILFVLSFCFFQLFANNKPYVILISFDGFRWDYSERGISPNLNKIKSSGVQALSLKPSFPTKTFPNHYTIVTGLYPDNHGIIFNSFTNPFTGDRYRLGDSISVRNAEWYLGEAFWETAERNGITTASYFWPGSEVSLDTRRPTYYKKYDHDKPYKERVDGIIDWLRLPDSLRPHFITLYFHDTDSYGHRYGPNSEEVNESIKRLDNIIGYMDSELKRINMLDSINIIIVSDHGMTEIDPKRSVNIESILNCYDIEFGGTKTAMMINPIEEDINSLVHILKKNARNYKVYFKNEIPASYNFGKHPFIYPIVLIADIGWSLVTDKWLEEMKSNYNNGNHGFSNNHTDMHGLFVARGPKFKSNFSTGTLNNIDIYPLLCRIFNIEPRSNIDGHINRIEFILK